MLDATVWQQLEGEGRRVVRVGGPDGKIIDNYKLIYYRHREKKQVKTIRTKVPVHERAPAST